MENDEPQHGPDPKDEADPRNETDPKKANPKEAAPRDQEDSEHDPNPKESSSEESSQQARGQPESSQGEAGDQQEPGSETSRGGMEQPYRGPPDRRGISAHGIEGETDLRRAKEYAEMIVDTVREGLLVLNLDLRVEAANESFYRMFEVDPSETEGRLIYELGAGEWDLPELRELLEEVLPKNNVMTGFEVNFDFEHIGRRILRLNARQLDEHQRILLAVEDVTETKEAEKRLRGLVAELSTAEQRERRRLASLLHDDQQQHHYGAEMKLGAARGKVDTDAARTAIKEAGEQIGEAVESARSLTRQLRPPALYEAGLAPALEWLASDMAERHGLETAVDTGGIGTEESESGAPEGTIRDDIKAMLYEFARELLFNVVKHAETETARLALRASTDRLHLVVEDEGRGFEVGKAFDQDALGQDTLDQDTAEAGFGLLSLRERTLALGGSVEIDSRPGEGTRVELALPLSAILRDEPTPPSTEPSTTEPSTAESSTTGPSEPGASASPGEEPQSEESSSEALLQESPPQEPQEASPHGSPPQEASPQETFPQEALARVVIADDHAVVRQGIANLIVQDERLAVAGEASTGLEAIDVVEQERPDAVLMDVNMPEMNGVEATREIRRRWPEVSVIGISVQSGPATEQSMLEAGAAAFMPKTGNADQVIDTVLRFSSGSSQTEE